MAAKQFEFVNSSDNLTPALKQILEFINNSLVENVPAIGLLFKAKIIVTELLTNSLKHSKNKFTVIDVCINAKSINISKTDHGAPFSIIMKTNSTKNKVPITNDILHTLYAIPKGKNYIRFICEESTMADILAVDNIIEHFGLIIITKAADEFVYRYENSTRTNIFIATLTF